MSRGYVNRKMNINSKNCDLKLHKHYYKNVLAYLMLVVGLVFIPHTYALQSEVQSGCQQASTISSDLLETVADIPDNKIPVTVRLYDLQIDAGDTAQAVVTWSVNQPGAAGFHVYRNDVVNQQEQLLGMVAASQYVDYQYIDYALIRGLEYTYRVCPYYVDEEGKEYEDLNDLSKSYTWEFVKPKFKSVVYSGKKVKLTWVKNKGVSGYKIYSSKKKSSGYKCVKSVDAEHTSVTLPNPKSKQTIYYKLRVYSIPQNNQKLYSDYSAAKALESRDSSAISKKFTKLKKQYPSHRYWNHAGKKKCNVEKVTKKPCNHPKNGFSKCNMYMCPDGIMGYQCYGFAWLMSDKIFGKDAKYKTHHSFKKAKAGDVIRYSGHSVIVTKKGSNYVEVGECNIGDTCMILWGRKIPKSELKGATYYTRY